jgi:hypothetical protein
MADYSFRIDRDEEPTMNKEDFLYDALPYIYTVGGVLTLLLSGETIGRASGVLLISAAMLVFHLRIDYRTKRARQAENKLTTVKMKLASVGV